MLRNGKVWGLLFCAGFFMSSSALFAQDKKPADQPAAKPAAKPADAKPAAPGDKKAAAPAGMPSPEEIAKMMAAGKPGEGHAKLKPLAGKWTYVTKMRMDPNGPWEESTGNAEYKWILDGRVLVQEIKGNPGPMDAMFGGPFNGFGISGFDNVSKKYWNTWTDNMSTGSMVSTGSADASGKVFTYSGEYNCSMTGEHKNAKTVLKIAGDDKLVFEMYEKPKDGPEFVHVEVTYTRVK